MERERIVRAMEDASGQAAASRRLADERRRSGQDLAADFAEMDACQADDEVIRLSNIISTEELP